MNYYAALSPAALDRPISIAFPNPIEWCYVKSDPDSLDRLRDAERIFDSAAESEDRDQDRRRALQSWRLACLSNDAERQSEAESYLATILDAEPDHPFAMMLGLARGYAFNKDRAEASLKDRIIDPQAGIEHILALAACFLSSNHTGKARRLLESHYDRFNSPAHDALWRHWYAQTLAAQNQASEAIRVLEASPYRDELREARTFALRAECRRSGDWSPLVNHLDSCYEQTRNATVLFELCELRMQLRQWQAVVDVADDLVNLIGTTEAVRLAADALFRAEAFKRCVHLLGSADRFFPSRVLPYDLRRARLECLRRLGSIAEARDEAERLAVQEDSTLSLLDLVRVYSTKGDFPGISRIARSLLGREDLSAEQALRLGWQIRLEDPTLAEALLRRSADLGFPDEAVAPAWLLANHLGAKEGMDSLTSRLAELAAKGLGGIQRVTVDNIPELMDQWGKRANEVNSAYESGSLPVHALTELGGVVLADLYHLRLAKNWMTASGLSRFRLLARHGGRPLSPPVTGELVRCELIIDITAFLLASHFEFLDIVKRAYGSLKISASLIPALHAMRDRLLSRQPEIVDDWRQILEFLSLGRIGAIPAALSSALETAPRVIIESEPDAGSEAKSVTAVVAALQRAGDLSASDEQRAAKVLGAIVPDEGSPDLSDGAVLIFRHSTIEVLAHAGAMDAASKRFAVSVEDEEIRRLRGELAWEEERRALGDWLGRRIEDLRLGLDRGEYQMLPIGAEDSSNELSTPEMACLRSLLAPTDSQSSIVWIDDRWANSRTGIGQVPIIDAIQVLASLRSAGHLSEGQYFETLLRMRSAGVLFVPFDSEEILFHLGRARRENGRVVESDGLRTLRRYAALCLESGVVLQKPQSGADLPNSKGELDFLVAMHRVATETIARCWQDSAEGARAGADWIIENLHVDLAGLSSLAHWRDSDGEMVQLMAVSLAGMIGRGFTLIDGKGGLGDLRRQYFEWLRTAVLEPRFAADPLLVQPVSDMLKNTLRGLVPLSVKTLKDAASIRVLQTYFTDLPRAIREEIAGDVGFMSSLGMKPVMAVHLAELSFESGDFVGALKKIASGRETTLKVMGSETAVSLRPCSSVDRKDSFAFLHPRTGVWIVASNDSIGVLRESVRKREQTLREHGEWFDLPKSELAVVIADIATTRKPASRMDKLRRHQEASAAAYYSQMGSLLHEKSGFQPNEVSPPAIEGFLRHLRLDPRMVCQDGLGAALERGAALLIEDEGLRVSLQRFAGLPCPLPASIVDAFVGGDEARRRDFVCALLELRASPLARAHLTHLLAVSARDDAKSRWQIERRLCRTIQSAAETEFRAFRSILTWSFNEIANRSAAGQYGRPVDLLLAWFHAHKLLVALRATRAPTQWIGEVFPRMPQRTPSEIFDRDVKCWQDVCHPARVSWESFGIAAVQYSCSGRFHLAQPLRVQAALQEFAVQDYDELRLPKPGMLVANDLGENSLGSFLGGDPISKLVDLLEAPTALNAQTLREQIGIEALLDRIEDPTRRDGAWPYLSHVLGSFSLPEGVRPKLRDVLLQIDFGQLVDADRRTGLIALFEASVQNLNLRDEGLSRKLRDAVLQVARTLSKDAETDGTERDALLLVEAAANVSLRASTPGAGVSAFALISRDIIDCWPAVGQWIAPLIQTFQRDLPLSQMIPLWPLSVRIRGE